MQYLDQRLWPLTREALRLIRDGMAAAPEGDYLDFARRYQNLCSTWNLAAKLMSRSDIDKRFDEHVADSLSLLPYLHAAMRIGSRRYIDIGSGAGFPALPLVASGVQMDTQLIERSERKCEFLRQMVREFGFKRLTITAASYPSCGQPHDGLIITSRATEKPHTIDEAILRQLGRTNVYLAQRKVTLCRDALDSWVVDDSFDRVGLRRSTLSLIADKNHLAKFHVEPMLRSFLR